MERNFYKLEVKSKRTKKIIKGFSKCYFGTTDHFQVTDERMKDIAHGVVFGLIRLRKVYADVYKKNEQGEFELIYTQN